MEEAHRIEKEYRGFKIWFDEEKDKWNVDIKEKRFSDFSIKKIKKVIDEELTEKKEMYCMGWNSMSKVEIIRGMKDGYGTRYWVRYEDGRREKAFSSSLHPVNKENTEIYNLFKKNEEKIDQLRQKNNDLLMKVKK